MIEVDLLGNNVLIIFDYMVPPWDVPYSYRKLSADDTPKSIAYRSSSGKYFLVPTLSVIRL